MPKLNVISQKIEAGLQHDATSKECVDCPNLEKTVSNLGRTVLVCGLYKSVNNIYHVSDVPTTVPEISINTSKLTAELFQRIVLGTRMRDFTRNSAFGVIGDQAMFKSLPQEIVQSPEDCPLLSEFVDQMINPRTTDITVLSCSDPVIRPKS